MGSVRVHVSWMGNCALIEARTSRIRIPIHERSDARAGAATRACRSAVRDRAALGRLTSHAGVTYLVAPTFRACATCPG